MERQQQPPPETFDFKIKFAETKAHAKVRKVGTLKSGALASEEEGVAMGWAGLGWGSGLRVRFGW